MMFAFELESKLWSSWVLIVWLPFYRGLTSYYILLQQEIKCYTRLQDDAVSV